MSHDIMRHEVLDEEWRYGRRLPKGADTGRKDTFINNKENDLNGRVS